MNQNYIPVLTRNGRPLAPCHPNRARSLVQHGRAHFTHRHGIRCIVLHKSNIPRVKTNSKVAVRINPGSRTTGIAVTRDHRDGSRTCLMALELAHHGRAITKRLIKRRKHRRNRRYRKTRYRQPRFNNRTRPPGWLPPSIRSRLHNTLTWVNRLSSMMPVEEVHVETSVFDPQVLRNPDIKGREYQQGPLYRTNLRAAVLTRDNRRCVYCGRTSRKTPLELEHVVPRASGGTDRYDNLVASCIPCNRRKANRPLGEFLRRRPTKLGEVQAKLGMDLADATQMNMIIPALITELEQGPWEVTEHAAATTAAGRQACGIEKSHHGAAAVTGAPSALRYIPARPITITATGRGKPQRAMVDKHGTPRGKEFRQYCKLPRQIQKQTPTPSHKKRQKRVGNVATGDYVTYVHQGQKVQGYGTISHQQVALTKPNWKSINADQATVIERNHGYQIVYPENPPLAVSQDKGPIPQEGLNQPPDHRRSRVTD